MLPAENWRIDLDERYPIYQQIINYFSRLLVKGDIKPGSRIPSIRDLAMALKVNANTIQRAYQDLERNELIFSQRGLGFFVMENEEIVEKVKKNMVNQASTRFLHEMRALGFSDSQIIAELESLIKEGGGKNDINDSQRS